METSNDGPETDPSRTPAHTWEAVHDLALAEAANDIALAVADNRQPLPEDVARYRDLHNKRARSYGLTPIFEHHG